jgi:uncharacterized membrane protein
LPTEWNWAALSNFCFNEDCYVSHAFKWNDGVLTDLGAILDGISSQANWISPNGLIAGVSENGEFDALISGFPEFRAVLWRNRSITDLGTLPQGYESSAYGVNSKAAGRTIGLMVRSVITAETTRYENVYEPEGLPGEER